MLCNRQNRKGGQEGGGSTFIGRVQFTWRENGKETDFCGREEQWQSLSDDRQTEMGVTEKRGDGDVV